MTTRADIEQRVFEAIGAASVCWKGGPSGTFDTELAKKVGDDLVDFILDIKPNDLEDIRNERVPF